MNNIRPKALVIAFKNDYLNRTDDVFYSALAKEFDLFFYGPGYQPIEMIEVDAMKVYDKYGPFDACFIHQYVLHNLISFPKCLQNDPGDQYFPFDRNYFCNYLENFFENYNEIPCLKFLISLRTDCYAFTEKEQLEYELFQGYLIIPPPELIAPVEEISLIVEEKFQHAATNRFIEYCAKNKKRIIPVAHLIAMNEFKDIPLSKKSINISVPGCPYIERQKAYKMLKKSNLKPINQLFIDKLVRYLENLFKIKIGSYRWGVFFFRWVFSRLIEESKITFTDGSRVRAPIRKYFEIPAKSSVLCAEGFYNYNALGFVAGEHFIEANSSSVVEKVLYLLGNTKKMEEIVNKSQQLIRNRHSDVAWSQYMIDIYYKIKQGSFKGAKWVGGDLKY